MIALAAFAISSCLIMSSGSDSIRAADLVPAFPEMTVLDPALVISPGPLPGLTRIFHPPELRRLAAVHGLASSPHSDICVTRRVLPLDPQRLLEAMRAEMPAARIELLDFSRQSAPEGPIHFSRNGLHIGSVIAAQGAIWTGWVEYGERGRFPIWARVRVPVSVHRGENVKVTVRSGVAQLQLDAVAEGAGVPGDTILVLNPVSHRHFPARIEGAGKVVVDAER
jgi:hypothetical protein